MGFFRHDAIVLTGRTKEIERVWERAVIHFEGSAVHVSGVTEYGINDTSSVLIAPDGSKEGWTDSDEGDRLRDSFVTWLQVDGPLIDWIEVRFGGDESDYVWVRTPNDKKFRYVPPSEV